MCSCVIVSLSGFTWPVKLWDIGSVQAPMCVTGQTHSLVHFSTACKEYVLQVGAVVKMSKWSCRILVE